MFLTLGLVTIRIQARDQLPRRANIRQFATPRGLHRFDCFLVRNQRIEGQRASNLKVRIVDHGHKLDAIFYSPEGSALQVRDTAQLEIEYLNGNSVVHREQVTQKYLALLTVGEDRWKVRVLEEEPKS